MVPFIASNQIDDNAGELLGGNFSSAKELREPSSKHKLLSNYPSEFPTFSNVSPTVPVARNTRYSNNEEPSENRSRSLDSTLESRLSDESFGLVSRPVGEMQSNSNRSSSKKVQKKRSSSSEKSIEEGHSKSGSSGHHELPGKSHERVGLVNKPIDEVLSYSDISLEESARGKPGEDRSNRKRSSKESMQDKSISSDSRLSDKSVDLINKPVDQLLSMSGYSDDFESDASDDKKASLAS